MNNIKILPANLKNKEDFGFIVNCEYELQKDLPLEYDFKISKSTVEKEKKKFTKTRDFLIAYCNDIKVGFCQYLIDKTYKKLEIDSIFVLPKFRSLGIGQKMILETEKIGRTKGCNFSRLFVEKNNPHALEFYQKSAYKIVGYKMEKNLKKLSKKRSTRTKDAR